MIISTQYPLHMWQEMRVEIIQQRGEWCHVVLLDPKISTTGTPITDLWIQEEFLEGSTGGDY